MCTCVVSTQHNTYVPVMALDMRYSIHSVGFLRPYKRCLRVFTYVGR